MLPAGLLRCAVQTPRDGSAQTGGGGGGGGHVPFLRPHVVPVTMESCQVVLSERCSRYRALTPCRAGSGAYAPPATWGLCAVTQATLKGHT